MRKLTTEEFIEQAKKIHGDYYDYSEVKYINSQLKIIINCPIHKTFEQIPNNHLRGRGCPDCGGTVKFTTTEFIQKANDKHNYKYDYLKSNYKNIQTKIIIDCPMHGEFMQTPYNHLNGQGCFECGVEKRSQSRKYSTEEFVEEAKKVHVTRYDYSKTVYVNYATKIIIICSTHGEFLQDTNDHLCGAGCPDCGGNKKSTTIEFIEKAKLIHSNEYDYSKVEYINAYTKIIIVCLTHGEFKQAPHNHLNGNGCHNCVNNISKPETQWLDQLNIPNDPQHRQVPFKINGKRFKVDGFDPDTNTVYEFYGDYFHGNPNIYPADAINNTVKKTFGELYQKTLAKEAILISAGYKIISIWEADFYTQEKLKKLVA